MKVTGLRLMQSSSVDALSGSLASAPARGWLLQR
jgi:hypothetical protein